MIMRKSNINKILLVLYIAILAAAGCGCAPTAKPANSSGNAAATVTAGVESSSPSPAAQSAEASAAADVTAAGPAQGSGTHTLDASVSEAIIAYNKDRYSGGDDQQFAAEYHDTLKTVEQDGKTTVYVVALYAQYKQENNAPKLTGAGCVPAALTFQKQSDGAYTLTEYWEAPDNSDEQSLQEKFPADAAKKACEALSGKSDGMKICDEKAKAYFSGKK